MKFKNVLGAINRCDKKTIIYSDVFKFLLTIMQLYAQLFFYLVKSRFIIRLCFTDQWLVSTLHTCNLGLRHTWQKIDNCQWHEPSQWNEGDNTDPLTFDST